MRNPKRIDKICNMIKRLWKIFPDMRFSQLLINFLFLNEKLRWNQEDDEFEHELDIAIKKLKGD